MQYFYHTAQGKATLSRADHLPLRALGQFKTEAQALAACQEHHQRATKTAQRFNRPIPTAFYL